MQVWSQQREHFRQWCKDTLSNDNYRSPKAGNKHAPINQHYTPVADTLVTGMKRSQNLNIWGLFVCFRFSDAADVRMDRQVVGWLKWCGDVWGQRERERDPFFSVCFGWNSWDEWRHPFRQTQMGQSRPSLDGEDNMRFNLERYVFPFSNYFIAKRAPNHYTWSSIPSVSYPRGGRSDTVVAYWSLRVVDRHALYGAGQGLLCSFLLLLPSSLLFLCFLGHLLINRSRLDELNDLCQTWRINKNPTSISSNNYRSQTNHWKSRPYE